MATPKQWGKDRIKDGRPQKLTEPEKAEVWDELAAYIKRTADPTLAGFVSTNKVALKYWVTKQNLNDWQDFSALRVRLHTKSEQYLTKNGGSGKYHPTMAKFRLRQPVHGYVERTETDITSKGEKIETGLNGHQLDQLVRARAKRSNS